MKFTNYALRIFEALESGAWRSSNEIAVLVATPLANLKSAFERLVNDGVIERNGNRAPAQYRRTPEPKGVAAAAATVLKAEIARERVSPDLRMRRDNPAWQAAAAKALGYCGLILPRENHFHGLFIMPEAVEAAQPLIDRAREHLPASDDNALANMMAASVASLAAGDFGRDPSVGLRLAAPLGAIRKLLDAPYFFIIATNEGAGYTTEIRTVPDTEITMAQVVMQRAPAEYMAGLMDKMPEVEGIKRRRATIQSQN